MSRIFIYSGDDIVSSRTAFLKHLGRLKEENFEVVILIDKTVSAESLELFSVPTSLFGQKRALVFENLLSGQKTKEKDKIIQHLSLLDCLIIIWENKDFSKEEQLKYSNFVFYNFKLPPLLFNFLESLAPQKTKENLEKFKKALEVVDVNFLFLMLVRQIRLLILVKDQFANLKIPSWQKTRLSRQAEKFSQEKLLAIYQQLLKIDFQQKSSSSPYTLQNMLELFLIEI